MLIAKLQQEVPCLRNEAGDIKVFKTLIRGELSGGVFQKLRRKLWIGAVQSGSFILGRSLASLRHPSLEQEKAELAQGISFEGKGFRMPRT